MSESRKYTEAQKQSAKKWDAANLDRISIALPKGRKDDIKAAAVTAGESMNQYIINAVDQRMERDAGGPQMTAGVSQRAVVELPSEAIKTAQEAAQAAGEDLPQFMIRAIQTQIEEDIGDRKADEDLATMLRETIESGMITEKNRILLEDALKSTEAKLVQRNKVAPAASEEA